MTALTSGPAVAYSPSHPGRATIGPSTVAIFDVGALTLIGTIGVIVSVRSLSLVLGATRSPRSGLHPYFSSGGGFLSHRLYPGRFARSRGGLTGCQQPQSPSHTTPHDTWSDGISSLLWPHPAALRNCLTVKQVHREPAMTGHHQPATPSAPCREETYA